MLYISKTSLSSSFLSRKVTSHSYVRFQWKRKLSIKLNTSKSQLNHPYFVQRILRIWHLSKNSFYLSISLLESFPSANSNEPAPKISSQTTTGTHFKPWQSTPSESYAETPSIAGKNANNLFFCY